MIYELKPMTSEEMERIMRKITCFIGVDAIDLLDVIYSLLAARIVSLGGEKKVCVSMS